MQNHNGVHLPAFCRWTIRLAGCLVPWHERHHWRERWGIALREWWTLVERVT
jgi:hypothetical protein